MEMRMIFRIWRTAIRGNPSNRKFPSIRHSQALCEARYGVRPVGRETWRLRIEPEFGPATKLRCPVGKRLAALI